MCTFFPLFLLFCLKQSIIGIFLFINKKAANCCCCLCERKKEREREKPGIKGEYREM